MPCQLPVFSRATLVGAMTVIAISGLSVSPANAQFVIGESDPNFLAFEAEQYDSLTGDPATGFIWSTPETTRLILWKT